MKNSQAISVTMPKELTDALDRMHKKKMKSYSALVSEAVREYVVKEEYKELVSRASKAAAKAGIFTEEDIDKAVHEVKRSARKTKNNG